MRKPTFELGTISRPCAGQVSHRIAQLSTKLPTAHIGTIPLRTPLFRGARRLRIALVGLPNSGKSTLFAAVASTSVQSGALTGTHRAYNECAVQIGLDEARVIDLPSIRSPHHLDSEDRAALKYLLWGDERPPVSLHEPDGPPAPFAPPDVIVQVLDATSLEHHLELTLKLVKLGRPLVLALNKMDEAEDRGTYVNGKALSAKLGVAAVPVTAIMGHGIAELFRAAVDAVRDGVRPLEQPPSRHITTALAPLASLLSVPEIQQAFRVPPRLLVTQIAEGDPYFLGEMEQHFPGYLPETRRLLEVAEKGCRARWPTSFMPTATIARRRCSKPRPVSARRTRGATGATGSTSCS